MVKKFLEYVLESECYAIISGKKYLDMLHDVNKHGTGDDTIFTKKETDILKKFYPHDEIVVDRLNLSVFSKKLQTSSDGKRLLKLPFMKIFKFKDEWFLVFNIIKESTIDEVSQNEYVICDQFEGLINYLKDNHNK